MQVDRSMRNVIDMRCFVSRFPTSHTTASGSYTASPRFDKWPERLQKSRVAGFLELLKPNWDCITPLYLSGCLRSLEQENGAMTDVEVNEVLRF